MSKFFKMPKPPKDAKIPFAPKGKPSFKEKLQTNNGLGNFPFLVALFIGLLANGGRQ